jgi:hypothetical protein
VVIARLLGAGHGDYPDKADRIVQYGFDFNGNQVQSIDARCNASTLVYDALNRLVATVLRPDARADRARPGPVAQRAHTQAMFRSWFNVELCQDVLDLGGDGPQ